MAQDEATHIIVLLSATEDVIIEAIQPREANLIDLNVGNNWTV